MKDLILVSLADYRLANLISKDLIAEPLRTFAGKKAAETEFESKGKFWHFLADLVTCPFCIGIWGAFFLTLAMRIRLGRFFVLALAGAGGQDIMTTFLFKDDR